MKTTASSISISKHWLLVSLTAFLILVHYIAIAQVQIGADIDGEAPYDISGSAVSMSDAYTVAVGAPINDDNGNGSGHVRVFKWSGSSWVQKGFDIDGDTAVDMSGSSVSMPDSNTVAIGSPNHLNKGHVRVFKWDGSIWLQKGRAIVGEGVADKFGDPICMPDSNTIAIGAIYNDGNGMDAGHVRVYRWNDTSWVQKGIDIDGETADDESGSSVSMPDSNTVAIGAPNNDGNGNGAGHVRIYKWNGNAWVQKGADIEGDTVMDYSGIISMPDSNTVAIGAPNNDDNGYNAGQVRIYKWNGSNWTQVGLSINGEAPYDFSGSAVSMPDSITVAIGAGLNDGNGSLSGHVRVYKWNGTNWTQQGVDIDGEAAGDKSHIVSMADNNTMAIGAIHNNGNGTNSGHVRVYSICTNAVDTSVTLSGNTLVSNDTSATYQWVNCDSAYLPVNGATHRSFMPPNNGNYSVIVSRSHCVDTSACYNVLVTGLERHDNKNEKLEIYPNPTDGEFTVVLNKSRINIPYRLTDVSGKVVMEGKLTTVQNKLDLTSFQSGIYILRVGEQYKKIVRK